MERLTPDVTLSGLPLSSAAYAASLRLLAEFVRAAGRGVSALRTLTMLRPEQEAWIALVLAGVVRVRPRPSTSATSFKWDVLDLTPYGQVYARQRNVTG